MATKAKTPNKKRTTAVRTVETMSMDDPLRPLSPWAYFGYTILFAIPVIGWIFLIMFALSDRNINRRNFARSYFIVLLVVVIIYLIALWTGSLNEIRDVIWKK